MAIDETQFSVLPTEDVDADQILDKALANLEAAIKDSKKKVQVSIQGDLLRVAGKDRDTLQEVMQLLRSGDFGLDLQFINYRSN